MGPLLCCPLACQARYYGIKRFIKILRLSCPRVHFTIYDLPSYMMMSVLRLILGIVQLGVAQFLATVSTLYRGILLAFHASDLERATAPRV